MLFSGLSETIKKTGQAHNSAHNQARAQEQPPQKYQA
jgi:hypothetical protein